MNNRVVHFEIPSDNPEQSIEFFKNAFGWNFEPYDPGKYYFALTGDAQTHGINGAVMKKQDPRQPVVNTINVENMEESIGKIEAAGGRIVLPKMPVPGMGWVAYFTDPDNNIHGIWQNDETAR